MKMDFRQCALLLSIFCIFFQAGGTIKLSYEDYEDTWESFKKTYHRQYSSGKDEQKRYFIFLENVHFIEEHNRKFLKDETSFYLDINQYTDMTYNEVHGFTRRRNRPKRGTFSSPQCREYNPSTKAVPDSFDWRDKGLVTPVKRSDIGCGASWAFSATGAVEGQWRRWKGELLSLSEQQLIDCSTNDGGTGCRGHATDEGFGYVISSGGLEADKTYPYTGQSSDCRFNETLAAASIQGCSKVVPQGSEEALKVAVGNIGPISISFDNSDTAFIFYKGGLFDDVSCSTTDLNFAALVVGYGSRGDDDYWIVKNSWGTTWGDDGYFYMARNKCNKCGVATEASFPTV